MTQPPPRGGSPRPACSLLGRIDGAEKAFLAGRRDRGKGLESSVGFFLESLRGFESSDFAGPCVSVFGAPRLPASTIDASDLELGRPAAAPEEAVPLIRAGTRPA